MRDVMAHAFATWIALLPASPVVNIRNRRYAENFVYDRSADYSYAFPAEAKVEVEVDGGFEWPREAGRGTAMLDLRVEATALGRLVDPYLAAAAGGERSVQYVERGAKGRRYFNLSEIPARAGERVSIEGAHLEIPKQRATPWSLPEVSVDGPVLVLGPHPDDCEIGAFGLYCDRDAWTVTVTAGEVGTHDAGGLFDSPDGNALRARTRVSESIAAPAIGGVPPSRAMNLGYFDGTLADLHGGRTVTSQAGLAMRHLRTANAPPPPDAPSWRSLVGDLVALIERIEPRTIAAPHPVLETHPDHRYTGFALLEALKECELDGNVFFYAVHTPGWTRACLHPVGPRDGVVSLPPLQLDEPLFETLHHEPLADAKVRRKILALDTYRDVRSSSIEPRSNLGEVVYDAARSVYRHLVVYDSSFVRKAARPNELYYVVPFDRAADYENRFWSTILRPA
jgi:LmbE family N-acetylglucosaminyl deacetylase